MRKELGISCMLCLVHVLYLAILVAIHTGDAANSVLRVHKVVYIFLKNPEFMAALLLL